MNKYNIYKNCFFFACVRCCLLLVVCLCATKSAYFQLAYLMSTCVKLNRKLKRTISYPRWLLNESNGNSSDVFLFNFFLFWSKKFTYIEIYCMRKNVFQILCDRKYQINIKSYHRGSTHLSRIECTIYHYNDPC